MSEQPSAEKDVLTEAEFGAVVERVMADEGWVCNPADHEDIPRPGQCINCDAERHRFGHRLHAALRVTSPGGSDA